MEKPALQVVCVVEDPLGVSVTVLVITENSVVGTATVTVLPEDVSVVKLAPLVSMAVDSVLVTVSVPRKTQPTPSQTAPGTQQPPLGLFGQLVYPALVSQPATLSPQLEPAGQQPTPTFVSTQVSPTLQHRWS